MSPRVVSIPNFKSQLALHAKRGNIKNDILQTVSKSVTLLQTTPNICILYIVGNHFSPWLTIQDHYLKIRLHLIRINYQSFVNLYGNACLQSVHFRLKWRKPVRRGGREELVGTLKWQWGWSETDFCCRSSRGFPYVVDRCSGWHTGSWEAAFPLFSASWRSSTGSCSSTVAALLGL